MTVKEIQEMAKADAGMTGRAVFFTRTNWCEPPRLRHQFARLLRDHGHEITFFERCHHVPLRRESRQEEGILFFRHPELLNHQLQVMSWIRRENAALAKRHILRALGPIHPELILNFNYDYGFLRELFPNSPLITVINDDFEAQAILPGMGRQIARVTAETCRRSDAVLAVSYPLRDKLLKFNSNTHLFFPWAQKQYSAPDLQSIRNVVLFWGYINRRLDWDVLSALAHEGIRLRFVGPSSPQARRILRPLSRLPNVEVRAATGLDDLQLSDVACLIAPYDPCVRSVRACTVPNKAFNILARGIPIAHAALPHLLQASRNVIRPCRNTDEYMEAIRFFAGNFSALQSEIRAFLDAHYAPQRYRLLMDIVSDAKG